MGTPWSEKALTLMGRASPTSLKVALAQLRRGAAMTFDEAMQMEFQLSQVFLGKDDLYEGIRAAVVDKDRSPSWRPDRLHLVTDEQVESYFDGSGSRLIFD
ncbi:MAG: enoyl-CoA hydratase/isomerase family protein [Pseudomonadota bacterium]